MVTGVRWAESAKRQKNRSGLEIDIGNKRRKLEGPDNPQNEEMARFCPTKGKHILNPIIDWSNEEVWEFIKRYNIPYCSLYDEGYTRLGCIGCPMSRHQREELERYPKYKKAYLRAFSEMLIELNKGEIKPNWKTAEEVMEWWIDGQNVTR